MCTWLRGCYCYPGRKFNKTRSVATRNFVPTIHSWLAHEMILPTTHKRSSYPLIFRSTWLVDVVRTVIVSQHHLSDAKFPYLLRCCLADPALVSVPRGELFKSEVYAVGEVLGPITLRSAQSILAVDLRGCAATGLCSATIS